MKELVTIYKQNACILSKISNILHNSVFSISITYLVYSYFIKSLGEQQLFRGEGKDFVTVAKGRIYKYSSLEARLHTTLPVYVWFCRGKHLWN